MPKVLPFLPLLWEIFFAIINSYFDANQQLITRRLWIGFKSRSVTTYAATPDPPQSCGLVSNQGQ